MIFARLILMDPHFEALLFSETEEVDFRRDHRAEELSPDLKIKLKGVLSLLIEQHGHIDSPIVGDFTKCLGKLVQNDFSLCLLVMNSIKSQAREIRYKGISKL